MVKLTHTATEGAAAKRSTKVPDSIKAPPSTVAKASITATRIIQGSGIATPELRIGLTDHSLLAAVSRNDVQSAADAAAIPKTATPVKDAQLTAAANRLAVANNVADNPSASGVAEAKRPTRASADVASHPRKSDAIGANKGSASSVPGTALQRSFNISPIDHAATVGQAAPQALATSAASAPLHEFEGAGERVSIPEVGQQVFVGQQTEPRSGIVGDSDKQSLLRVTGLASNAIAPRGQDATTAGSARWNRGSEAAGAVEQVLSVQVQQTIASERTVSAEGSLTTVAPAATTATSHESATALPHRSIGLSERVPVSGALPGAPSPEGVERESWPREAVESPSFSTEIGDGTAALNLEAQSRAAAAGGPVPSANAEAIVKQQATTNGSHTVDGSLPETRGTTQDAPGPGGAEIAFGAALAGPAEARVASSVSAPIAPESGIQAELPQTPMAVASSAHGAAKDKSAKRTADDLDSAAARRQSTSSTEVAASTPVQAADGTRDSARGLAAGTVSNAPTPVAHAAVAAASVPAPVPLHGSSAAVPVIANPASARTEAVSAGAPTTLSSASAQSVEQHRTLLATPTALEVGVQTGTQGWLKIRAEVGGQGEVKASLDAVSTGGRELLHSQLPALNAFLHSEQMTVTASVAERSAGLDASTPMGSGGAGGFASSNGSLLQDDGGQRQTGQQLISTASETVKSYNALVGVSDSATALSGMQAGLSDGSGRWLNIRV